MNLLRYKKPSRYINHEVNAVRKDAPVSVALAFPDIYEVGMSHIGLKILYAIVNDLPFASAERVFSPWPDLEEALKKSGTPLASLESGRPLRDFDILGFSLQYELSYTTVLNMLHLGGLPIRTEDRLDKVSGGRVPLVIAGGPCAVNPLPMAPFIDAFLIGEAEEAIGEILQTFFRWKTDDGKDRQALLQALTGIGGVYVPLGNGDRPVRRRYVASLDDAPFPEKPVVPFPGIIHDRVAIEISRGCSRGCRFCQAGVLYRPVRERSVEKIISIAEASLRQTGYDSVSFSSLSTGDYSCLVPLLRECNRRFSNRRISISLPSLRVGAVTPEMLKEIQTVRKTGFTIAPEAGTDRLRAVINKDFTEDTYTYALENLFRAGWRNLKLYFMTGLPTETEEDVRAIPEMVLTALRLSKKILKKHVNISAGVSSFIPKPHTPFQWLGQADLNVLRERNAFVKQEVLRRGVQFRGHNEEMSLLEAAFSRGDETIARLIEASWKLGSRLDAWTELFDFTIWRHAMDSTGLDAATFACRNYTADSALPWEKIETGVSRSFLWRELERARSGAHTADCRDQCHVCGLTCTSPGASAEAEAKPLTVPVQGYPKGTPTGSLTVRMAFSKTGTARYLSHLELATAVVRAMRRADFPFRYTEGFHPSPRISFGPALGVGIAGLREYLDVDVVPPFDLEKALLTLNATLPDGLRVHVMTPLHGKERSLDSFVVKYAYDIRHHEPLHFDDFLGKQAVIIERNGIPVNLREMVNEIRKLDDWAVRIILADLPKAKTRIAEILPAIFSLELEDLDVTRVAMYGWAGSWREPIPQTEPVWAARS